MNGTLGRDKVWNEHIWSEIDKAVREEVGRIRVAQKVFPSKVVNNVLPVCTTRAVPFGQHKPPADPMPDEFQPFFEISTEFVLTQAQVEGEGNERLAASFARLAASVIADAEDSLLFLGPGSIPPLAAAGLNVTNQPPAAIPPQFASIPPGFVAEADNFGPTLVRALAVPPPLGVRAIHDIMTAVADGMTELNHRAQPGPYALFLSPIRYAQTFSPITVGVLQTPGDEIKNVVTGGVYMVNRLAVANLAALPARPAEEREQERPREAERPREVDIGILVSLGGEPAKIVLGTDAITAFTLTDLRGNYHFRVFERIQMVVRDGRAFQTLAFQSPAAAEPAAAEPAAQNPQPQNRRAQNRRAQNQQA
jgi:hypothetical protein